jgi:hypothetical protein
MTDNLSTAPGTVEPFPIPPQSAVVSDELGRISSLLKSACPGDALIRFEFDERLRVHIDVRKQEELTLVEMQLEKLCHGLFSEIRRGDTPHRPFYHRVTALVAR